MSHSRISPAVFSSFIAEFLAKGKKKQEKDKPKKALVLWDFFDLSLRNRQKAGEVFLQLTMAGFILHK